MRLKFEMPSMTLGKISTVARPITVPEAKADPVLRRFELRRLRLPLGRETISLVVPDAREWIRRGEWTAATERGAEPPYWVQIWPASIAAARLLARCDLAGKRVLDLGCGLGVPGLAAVRAGADTTFADRQTDALAFAGWNADRHRAGNATVTLELDWSADVAVGTFDVLVLADVSYRPLHHLALQRHLSSCLAPGGVVLHADPGRRESTPFVRWLQANYHTRTVHRSTTFEERRLDIRLCLASSSPHALDGWSQALGENVSTQLPESLRPESAPPGASPTTAGPAHSP